MDKRYYITTTLPYVNAKPHVGFALEIIQADVMARYYRLLGHEVIFNTGTDEHGQKIYQKAQEEGKDVQVYVDEYAAKFDDLKETLNLTYNHFIRTTDEHHVSAAQEFWKLCDAKGDIYKKDYKVKYCVGCELEKTDSELVEDRCPDHPNFDLEIRDEENYFFKFSNYQDALVELYTKNPEFVVPNYRLKEIRNFVEGGLQDFSVSRLKEKMSWGVPVPGDEEHVMYVWFDALVNYISTLGWPDVEGEFKFWPGVQVAGKDNLRQQSAMWQAMLMSAGIETSKQIYIHGFITSGGQKMSKSLGNVVDPFEIVQKYGSEALRYYLLREIASGADGDFTIERFEERFNSDLADELGNLVQRTLTMTEKFSEGKVKTPSDHLAPNTKLAWGDYILALENYQFHDALNEIWKLTRWCNQFIDEKAPWKMAKEGKPEDVEAVLYTLLETLRHVAWMLQPIMPETSNKILISLGFTETGILELDFITAQEWGGLPEGYVIQKVDALFPKLES